MHARYEVKCKLLRLLYARNWDATLIREFLTVIDWMMALPPALEMQLDDFITVLEEDKKKEYITSIERVRSARQLEKGLQEGEAATLSCLLNRLLTRRFGDLPQALQEQVKHASNAQIEAWFDRAINAPTLDEVFQDVAH